MRISIRHNVSLRDYSTMRLGGSCRYLTEVHSADDVEQAVEWADSHHVRPLMIGGGSNIIWRDEGFDGLLLVNRIAGYDDSPAGAAKRLITIGAGEEWDRVVGATVRSGLTGIEALSLIPGTAGATPVQNVGAYGQEIAQTLRDVRAYDLRSHSFVTIGNADCAFGYRKSRFNTVDRGRFLIVSLSLQLTAANPMPPFYAALQNYFGQHPVDQITPAAVRAAVIDIRSHKLPDPAVIANNGSFFANPVVDADVLSRIQTDFPDVRYWPTKIPGKVKVSAAWLIEHAGFADYNDTGTGMATWHGQPLIVVNEHAVSCAQLLEFKHKLVSAVRSRFDITLEQEPELLP